MASVNKEEQRILAQTYGENAVQAYENPYHFDTEASFIYPIIKGKLHLGKRNTQPHKGMWGPIGGKQESRTATTPQHIKPKYITKMGGSQVESLFDTSARQQGLETAHEVGEREFAEEAYANRNYPQDFREDAFTNHQRIGYVFDAYQKKPLQITRAAMILMNVKDTDFALSPRELAGLKPIQEIAQEEMFELGKVALKELQYLQKICTNEYAPESIRDYLQQNLIPTEMQFSIKKTYKSLGMMQAAEDFFEKAPAPSNGWWMDRQ